MEDIKYFCPKCNAHRDIKDTKTKCPECGGKCLAVVTTPEAIDSLDNFLETECVVNPGVRIHPPQVYAHRFAIFMQLGFGPAESISLANSREDTHKVKKMLREGCSVSTAVAILL